jgi:hypothetical protein
MQTALSKTERILPALTSYKVWMENRFHFSDGCAQLRKTITLSNGRQGAAITSTHMRNRTR